MPAPQIDRIKTSVFFTDTSGVEWEVNDARRRPDGTLRRQYPGSDDAELRYFVRYGPFSGAHQRPVLEIRRYRFETDDSRWFTEDLWQMQLDMSELREPRRSALEPARISGLTPS